MTNSKSKEQLLQKIANLEGKRRLEIKQEEDRRARLEAMNFPEINKSEKYLLSLIAEKNHALTHLVNKDLIVRDPNYSYQIGRLRVDFTLNTSRGEPMISLHVIIDGKNLTRPAKNIFDLEPGADIVGTTHRRKLTDSENISAMQDWILQKLEIEFLQNYANALES